MLTPEIAWVIIIFLVLFSLYILIWQIHLLVAVLTGAPVVATHRKAIEDALELARIKKDELLLDLGCGSGKVLIHACKKYQVKCIGVERSPLFYLLSRLNVWLAGKSRDIKIIFGDFKKIEKHLQDADVIYLYLLKPVMGDIEEWFFANINPETRVVSMSFTFARHEPVKMIETTQLWQKTKIRLYSK